MKKITCKRWHIFASAIDSGGGPQNYGGIPISTVDMGTGVPKTRTGVPKSTGSPKLYDTGPVPSRGLVITLQSIAREFRFLVCIRVRVALDSFGGGRQRSTRSTGLEFPGRLV